MGSPAQTNPKDTTPMTLLYVLAATGAVLAFGGFAFLVHGVSTHDRDAEYHGMIVLILGYLVVFAAVAVAVLVALHDLPHTLNLN